VLDSKNFIVRTLLADGLITEADLRRATEHSMATASDLLDSMVQLGIATSRRLAIAKAKICEHPFVDLSHYEVDFRNTKTISRTVAERLTAFPLFIVDGVATVAMLDPLNLQAIDQVRQLLRCDVDPVLADAEQLRALIARAYSLVRDDVVKAKGPGSDDDQVLTTGDEPVVAAVNQIIAGAVDAGTSDIHINPEEGDLMLRYRVDGTLAKQQAPPRAMHEAMVQRLKVLAKLDLTQTRKPQDGKFRFRHKNDYVDIRLSLIPTIHGENVVMRLLRSASNIGPIAGLGMPPEVATWYEEIIQKPHGIVLVTGPTGSGKTTTLYTALNRLNSPDRNIITIEDPVEIRLPVVRQVQVNADVGLTFATALRSILRQDPDVVLVGEIRDQETAKIAVQAAMTGHLVFSTLHTNDAVGSLTRLKDFGLPTFAINSALLCAIAQRLVRKLCAHCAASDTQHPLLLSMPPKFNGTTFKRPVGCQECRGAGYRGRLGVFEMLRMTQNVQKLVEIDAKSSDILEAAKRDGMKQLFDDGLAKASRGLTSLEEVAKLRAEVDEIKPHESHEEAPAGARVAA
jgi:type IV pilus assembly protein PilB